MTLRRIGQLARQAAGFRKFLRTPIDLEAARNAVKQQLENREKNFLSVAKQLIYDVPSSPYRRLLLWAGCEYGDLCENVKARGLEATLEKLRDQGVYLALEEFKSRAPICRGGLTFETLETDFDNPFLLGGEITGETSGSRSKSSHVMYDWDFIAEEACHEAILYAVHDVLHAPFSLWYPVPPGIAGLHNVLLSLKFGAVPEKWFSQSPCGFCDTSVEARLALEFVIWGSRIAGYSVARPSFVELSGSRDIVRWLETTTKKCGRAVIRTFGSSAVRLAQTALSTGADLRGGLIFSGGEPLTELRRRFIESAGVGVYSRYVAAETGLVAAGCPHRTSSDDMHFYSDRLACIRRDRNVLPRQQEVGSLLFTVLTLHAPKVLLNTEMGDCAALTNRRCSCTFGELGFDVHLSSVRSYDKLTVEGMTILTAELDAIIGCAIERAGGQPDSYQFWETQSPSGLHRLTIAVSPEVTGLDEAQFVETIIAELRRSGPRKAMAAEFWGEAASFIVIREPSQSTAGHKMHAIRRSRPSCDSERDRNV